MRDRGLRCLLGKAGDKNITRIGKAGWKFASGQFGRRMKMGGEVKGRIEKKGTGRDLGCGFE